MPIQGTNAERLRVERSPWWLSYGLALALVTALTVVLVAIQPYLPLGNSPISYIVLIMALAYWFGEGPTVFALLLSLVIYDYYFVPPLYAFWPPGTSTDAWARYASFAIGATMVGFATLLIRTAQRRAEQSFQQMSNTLESITDAFFTLDYDWRFSYVNREAQRILRKTADELLGVRVWDLFPDAIHTASYTQYHRAVAEQVAVAFEDFYAPFDAWYEVRAYPGPEGLSVYYHDVTERKRADQALQLSQWLLNRSQEIAHLGSWELDLVTNSIKWSDEVYRIFGMQPQEFSATYEAVLESVHPDDRTLVDQAYQGSIRDGKDSYEVEHRIVKRDSGEIRWVHEKCDHIRDSEGRIIRSVGMVQDITERKQAEDALRESTEMLRLVLDTIPAWVFWKDRNSVYLGCNRLNAQNAGLADPSEIVGKTDFDMPWGPTEAEAYRADDRLVMESGVPKINYEETQHTADGRDIWIRTSKVPLKDAQGQIIGVLGTFEDITERKQAEQALRESAAFLEQIISSARDGVVVHDRDMRIVVWNPRMVELTGVSADEAIGKRPPELFPALKETGVIGTLETALAGEVPDPVEFSLLFRTGQSRWGMQNTSPLRNTEGDVIGTIGIIRDITERKQAEEALRESEARFAMAQAAADIGTWEHDVTTGATKWSDNLFGMFGLPVAAQSPPYKQWLQMIHPEDRQRVQNDLARALSTLEPFATEYRFVWPDLTIRWLMARAQVICDDQERPQRLVGIAMDITETVELQRRLQHQLNMLQSALVPQLPSATKGYRTSTIYIPAFAGEDIGGDLYDVFTTESDQIAVVVGDVAGKGIEAAALAANARSTIHSFAYELDSPALVLSHTSAVLQSGADASERFVTAFLAIVEPKTGRTTFASAGHPPAAVLKADGRVEFLDHGCGPPLAAFAEQRYVEFEYQLDLGDKVILYTDGILEARSTGDVFSLEGIERTLEGCEGCPPDETASALVDAARNWAEGCLRDDVAVVVVERST